jgi:hypothetical protein
MAAPTPNMGALHDGHVSLRPAIAAMSALGFATYRANNAVR